MSMKFNLPGFPWSEPEIFDLSNELFIRLDDCRIRVRTNSSSLRQKLAFYLQPFLVPALDECHINIEAVETEPPVLDLKLRDKMPDPGKKRIKEQYLDTPQGRVVRKTISGMVFYFNTNRNLAIGPCSENDNQIINFINNRFIQWKLDQGCLLCHAAGVARNNQGIILAGFSGMGKSTLALHLMNKDLTFISNDRLMVEEKESLLTMYGVPKLPRVNPGTILNNPSLFGILKKNEIEKFKRMGQERIWDLEHKYDVFLDQCFGSGRFRLKSGVKALVILNWQRDSSPLDINRVDLKKRPDLLDTVIKSPGLFYLLNPPEQSLSASPGRYLDVFSLCDVYEISGGTDFHQAAERCLELIF